MFIKTGVPLNANSDLSGYTAAKSILRNFANKMSKEATEVHYTTQNKIVAGLIKDLEDAKKEQEKAEKAIKEAKEEIKDTKLSIKEKTKFIDRNKKTKNELSKKIKE